MKHNNVRIMARKVKRDLKKGINLLSLTEYVKGIGYRVVYFNTPLGDKLISLYGLEENAKAAAAFTVSRKDNVIFVDRNSDYCDKVYNLLHEIGHIVLGHIGDGKAELRNKTWLEIEANAFVYEVATHNNILLTALRETAEKIKLTYQSAGVPILNGGQLAAADERS